MLNRTLFQLVPFETLSNLEKSQRMPDYNGSFRYIWHLKAYNPTYYHKDARPDEAQIANMIVYDDHRNRNLVLFYYRTVNGTLTVEEDIKMRELMKEYCKTTDLFPPDYTVAQIPHGSFFEL